MASNSNTRKKSSSSGGRGKTSSSRSSNKKKKKASGPSLAGEIIFILVLALAVFMILANFGLCGKVGHILQNTTFGLFGVLGYVAPFLWIVYACFVISNPHNTYLKLKLFLGVLLLIFLCAACQMISMKEFVSENTVKDYYNNSLDGKNGGGFFGGLCVMILYPFVGSVGTWLIIIALIIVLLLFISEFSIFDFFRYQAESFRDSYQENRELHEIKAEKNRVKHEEQLAENRRKNGEKMLKARRELEASRKPGLVNTQTAREGKVENPLSDVLPKEEAKPARTAKTSRSQTPREEQKSEEPKQRTNSRMPNFLKSVDDWEPLEPDKQQKESGNAESIEDIIKRELNKNNPSQSESVLEDVDDISDVTQMNVSDYGVETDTGDENTSQYDANGMPVRKRQRRPKSDDTKTVETGNGRIILAAPGTGSTSHVEAEGHESDPHGTGDRYADDDEKTPAKEQEREYIFPPLRLLSRGTGGKRKNIDRELKETALKLQQTLQNFGVGVNITNVSCGPAVTRYELTPEMGVKVSKIVALQDDIKLNLAASDIRIEAPIPGKAAIGIEVPNKENVAVNLRDIIESEEFSENKSKLAFACGKDIGGQIIIGDIAKMPHLLIAGATGSGKSVCINTIIVSILYHAKPSEVKLLMIDPKVVELSVYNGIPHLLKPVVTDPKQAAGVLAWAVSEMTDRYKRFAEQGVRDIKGYNEKIRDHYKGRESEMPKLMPQIVIIVDELADLMMVAPSEVEDSILHLAQMARAAGMHLILATQRPSVNVITGVIKANIPSRIAFAVSSGVDSRTILDMIGAEKLLGKGDMLYYPTGMQKPIRVQGALVTDKEVSAIVDFLKQQGSVAGGGYDNKIDLTAVAAMTDTKAAISAAQGDNDKDQLFKEAGDLIISIEKASIGMLQRKFRIGFNRAARIMDQLCEAGVVGEEEGTKPRAVLMTREQFEQYCEENNL